MDISFSDLIPKYCIYPVLRSNLLKVLRCGRQQHLSIFNPLPGEIDILAQSIVLQPATYLLLGPLAEWNIHITEINKTQFR